jgi:Leucine-rich repeat (LRR) protein
MKFSSVCTFLILIIFTKISSSIQNNYKQFKNIIKPSELSIPNISCNFHNFSPNFYICELFIKNSKTFTIKSQHLPSKSDSDVTQVHLYGSLTNFSQNICNQFRNLKKIFAIKLEIEKISESSFANCSNLIHLDLEENKISEINFEGLKSLKFLNLKSNEISELNFEAFKDLKNVRELNLDENLIKNLPNEIFEPLLGSMEKISLRKNKFEGSWKSEWLKSSQKLKYFDIGENNLREIEENSFNSSEIFAFLIDENLIGNLNSTQLNRRLENLKYLIANENEIIIIDSKFFNEAEKLKFLDLGENLCINETFKNFKAERDKNLKKLKLCFGGNSNLSTCE